MSGRSSLNDGTRCSRPRLRPSRLLLLRSFDCRRQTSERQPGQGRQSAASAESIFLCHVASGQAVEAVASAPGRRGPLRCRPTRLAILGGWMTGTGTVPRDKGGAALSMLSARPSHPLARPADAFGEVGPQHRIHRHPVGQGRWPGRATSERGWVTSVEAVVIGVRWMLSLPILEDRNNTGPQPYWTILDGAARVPSTTLTPEEAVGLHPGVPDAEEVLPAQKYFPVLLTRIVPPSSRNESAALLPRPGRRATPRTPASGWLSDAPRIAMVHRRLAASDLPR